ncbi:phenolpthiocerol synthesis polyketide synthase ppsB [Nannizzia gypsea CBS 118893]|uniref:Non-reducing polyketide synthase nscA n=1 Tax=Arthroderma gypseum (strain ATCC MYA-4604 / CBS 118893) TaxID=535722 RepID=E4V415_ARTGP|nr:phenolpthiocerol synthesis polyketide synthase ppsB [Nannizzia gypsea CBS 118893]EFR04739.1 phenolpthiocerol synthesis polyketide synthase ppsB [Nannizzia gypsea CBS 118893]
MVGTLSTPTRAPTIHLFGPQALAFRGESFDKLKVVLFNTPYNEWILNVIETLPGWWNAASKELPFIQAFPGGKLLDKLATWVKEKTIVDAIFPLPNILLTPLVVITHLIQYQRYLEHIDPTCPADNCFQSPIHTESEALGLCTGLLAAIAVSRSASPEEFRRNGATAIRLAMLIGALVDSENESNSEGGAVSQSITWDSLKSQVKMLEILKQFPHAYISVLYDEKRATVTCTKFTAAKLANRMRKDGLVVSELNLHGYFHYQGHQDAVDLLIRFCDSKPEFQYSTRSASICSKNDHRSYFVKNKKPHELALRSILVEQCDWYRTFAATYSSHSNGSQSQVVLFGHDNCVPPSVARNLGRNLINATNLEGMLPSTTRIYPELEVAHGYYVRDTDDIAVVGMACKVAGADDIEQFWDILRVGESQHTEPPSDRFHFGTFWRDLDPKRRWYGNFITDPDAFDHKFFRKSPREMMSTDPQQRWMLQIVYQALQQSGYFLSPDQDKHIGCYIGLGCVDYEHNIACYPANAFSATGNLRSFVAGKVSHYFGWTGPSLTIDSACSSSAVAIHHACKAILHGECTAAIAGGVTILTSPLWFQNLAGASFLSPTGNCKPFDTNADGYCRGEGVGAVVLKRLSSALDSGDQILGVISSSAVYQNQNCTPITVPNADSLSDLFRDVTHKAGLEPKHISVVEAHGTGTPVGDPAEYESILRVFGGPDRLSSLSLGSVKGLVGHAETAAGIISLIKVLLMIQERHIPPQASFQTINPAIKQSPTDKIEITTSLTKWDTEFRAALINNYGASGSNASLIVTQTPNYALSSIINRPTFPPETKYPFWFCGSDDSSLQRYVVRFRKFLESRKRLGKPITIPDLAFNVYRQSNRTLSRAMLFNCGSVTELEDILKFSEADVSEIQSIEPMNARSVIMCFGGQISTFVGLDREIYDTCKIFRKYIDQCNFLMTSLGPDGLFPDVFQKSPVQDVVKLQTMLFAIQYASAMSWIECGVKPAALVGHSFGELTALCVSGVLSLAEAVKIIAGRARLVRDLWGVDKGFMMAIEGDIQNVQHLLSDSNRLQESDQKVTIACYNGPRSFTIAGPANSAKVVEELLANNPIFSSVKSKKLNVTNAYHSILVGPLVEPLRHIGESLTFTEGRIPVERCTEHPTSSDQFVAEFIADHMRCPVYFNHAVQRLSLKYPSSIWLEAGSNSTITTMAGRALNLPSESHFQGINISSGKGLQSLADTTINLWMNGLNTAFWPHHSSQTPEYNQLLLPPYQFDKTRHWVTLKRPEEAFPRQQDEPQSLGEQPMGLWSFSCYKGDDKRSARFSINTASTEFHDYVAGHTIAHAAPLCPSTLQLDIVIEALLKLRPEYLSRNLQPQLQGLENHVPICLDPTLCVWLDVEAIDSEAHIWDFKMISEPTGGNQTPILHVSGKIGFKSNQDTQLLNDFARYERLSGHERCLSLLNGEDGDDIIQGRNVYKVFAEVVDYGQFYRGVQKLVGKGNESAGRVVKKYTRQTWLDTPLADSFCQCAGIFVNCMTDISDKEMYISTKIEQWIRSPNLLPDDLRPDVWNVFALHRRPSDKEFLSDVFIFDSRNGELLEIILGIGYKRVSKRSLGKMLTNLTPGNLKPEGKAVPLPVDTEDNSEATCLTPSPVRTTSTGTSGNVPPRDVSEDVRNLLANVSGLEAHEIKNDTGLSDIGIDSLMGMELAREIETVFKCSLDTEVLNAVTDFKSLIKCIQESLGCNVTDGMVTEPATNMGSINTTVAQITNDPPHINGSLAEDEIPSIPPSTILSAFEESNRLTDEFISKYKFANYADLVLPKQTELCIAYITEAFEKLGCSFQMAKGGERLDRVPYLPKHHKFVNYLYMMLEKEARLVDVDENAIITRTAISPPLKHSSVLLQELINNYPDHANDHKLTHLIGSKLAECLSGGCDGVQLIFGSSEGRELVSGLYGKSPINMVWLKQMEDIIHRLIQKLPVNKGPLKILEMGAGTGGTTAILAPFLSSLGVPVEYTFTDISPSLVAAARKRFKAHSFMKFCVHDIEKEPATELLHSQHIVIAANCVHATHNLVNSTKQIRQVLRPDGFLMILEMTDTLYWVDVVFGVLEGWWLYNDGRKHVVANQVIWEKSMHLAGYGYVDWTSGARPESSIQRLIIALASGPRYDRLPVTLNNTQSQATDCAVRQAIVDNYANEYSRSFLGYTKTNEPILPAACQGHSVLITGATGSLGSHLVAHFAQLPTVREVVCLNRRNSVNALERQIQSLEGKDIFLDGKSWSKLRVIATQGDKEMLGLQESEYQYLVRSVTHIVHGAWPMSIKRPVKGFEPQFQFMRNLIDMAAEISNSRRIVNVGFQFISSIATVGYHPIKTHKTLVSEQRVEVDSVLPSGYGDAKLVCEKMMEATLHKQPDRFRPMSVRIGQISGSRKTGYWNPVEHFSFLVKSSQTLRSLPDLKGELSWCPVDDVAAALADILLSDTIPYPIYHIENPIRQPWSEIIYLLADTLDIPRGFIVPYDIWMRRVRHFTGSTESNNPAKMLLEFFRDHFRRMSCGGLILDTTNSKQHSHTLANTQPITPALVAKYIAQWKESGFLG